MLRIASTENCVRSNKRKKEKIKDKDAEVWEKWRDMCDLNNRTPEQVNLFLQEMSRYEDSSFFNVIDTSNF